MIQPIVLAAGLGTRLGAVKALLLIEDQPALAIVLKTIRAAGLNSPIVVLGHDVKAIREAVNLAKCKVVVNEHPELGLSESMKLGLNAIDKDATGVLVFHVDMPYLAAATIVAVVQKVARGVPIAAPSYGGNRGFPVYFDISQIDALSKSLHGDSGGRDFLALHSKGLTRIPVNDPGCVFDIDRPSDLDAWKGEPLCSINE